MSNLQIILASYLIRLHRSANAGLLRYRYGFAINRIAGNGRVARTGNAVCDDNALPAFSGKLAYWLIPSCLPSFWRVFSYAVGLRLCVILTLVVVWVEGFILGQV